MLSFHRLGLNHLICAVATTAALSAQAQLNESEVTALPDIVRVCADVNGFPPFSYDLPESRGQVQGFNVDLLNLILDTVGVHAEYHMMPWRRCLMMAESGDTDILLDAQETPARRHFLLFPTPHYETRPAMLAASKNRDLMPMINSKERMLALDVCRMPGWDTSAVALESELILAGEPRSLDAALTMLRLGRCDLVIYTRELFTGGLHAGAITAADVEGIDIYFVPWVPNGIPKFFGISRQAPTAQAIYDLLDRSIRQLHNNGELARLLSEYLPSP